MKEVVGGSIYHQIADKLSNAINVAELPLYGEYELKKYTAGRYGKVKIKLDLENDLEFIEQIESYGNYENKNAIPKKYYTYKWEANEDNLPKQFEHYVKPIIEEFIKLFSLLHKNDNNIYCFSIVDGAYKDTERPGHRMATQFAIIDLFNKMHGP